MNDRTERDSKKAYIAKSYTGPEIVKSHDYSTHPEETSSRRGNLLYNTFFISFLPFQLP